MIDVHSHTWDPQLHFTEQLLDQAVKGHGGKVDLSVGLAAYRQQAPEQIRTIVFGGKARLSGIWTDNAYVAEYVAQDPDLIGFLSVDPTQDGWEREMRQCHQELGFVGIKLLPMYAGFRPDDERCDPLWRYAQRNGLPVLVHTGTTFIPQAPIECTLPRHIDTVARRFPDLAIVMAHLGHPFEGECIAVVRKHDRVFADVSALHYRPFQLHHSLILAKEYGVWSKLLFGSDYPFTTVNASIAGLRTMAEHPVTPGITSITSDDIEDLIHRDSLALLGLAGCAG